MKYTLKASARNVHWGYCDSKLKPVLKIKNGDTIEVYTVSGTPEIINLLGIEDRIPKELVEIHMRIKDEGLGPHLLLGPVFVEGATVEDTLEVNLLEIEPWMDFGFNLFLPGKGALPEDFPYFRAKSINIDRKMVAGIFSDNLKIPLRPFFGYLCVAPASHLGRVSSRLPGPHGGNLDNKELATSSKVYLPIHNEGGLFSLGDGHLCQGDGEADGTGLETSLKGLVKLSVIKGVKIKWPMAETKKHFIFMGFGPDLDEAFKMALRNTLEFLVTKGFEKDDAYMFSSLNVDFHITQVVNDFKGVHALVPRNLLRGKIDSMV